MNNNLNPKTPPPATTNSGPPSLVASGSQSTTGYGPNNHPFVSVANLFLEADLSPPALSEQCPLQDVINVANNSILARLINDPDIPNYWKDLDSIAQVGLAFLIYKKQHEILLGHLNGVDAARLIMKKVQGLTDGSHSTLLSFIRQGGDNSYGGGAEHGSSSWEIFLGKHPEWVDDDSAFTIFTHLGESGNLVESPLVRDQDTSSLVCWIISAAQVLLYVMILRTGSSLYEGISAWGINIGRFMRNNLTNEQIFQSIFGENGGYPEGILETLLEHTAVPRPESHSPKTRRIAIDYTDSMLVHGNILNELETRGALLVKGLKVFPGYIDASITEHSGNLEALGGCATGHSVLHACVVTGVVLTGSDEVMGGVKFLMQDSIPGRPFVGIGLDLLRSMGIKYFEVVEDDVYFPGTTDMHKLDNVPVHTSSGSPHSSKFPSSVFGSEFNGVSIEECLTESQDSGKKTSPRYYMGLSDFQKEGAEKIDFRTYVLHTSGKPH